MSAVLLLPETGKRGAAITAGGGITVIATNIETEEQKQIAVYLGCALLQGHLFAKASPTFSSIKKTVSA